MDLDEAIAELVIGMLRPELLPSICTTALVNGYDSPSLAIRAAESVARLDVIDARERFGEAVRELQIPWPTTRQAADLLLERAAVRGVRRECTPREALDRIMAIHQASESDRRDSARVGDYLGIERLAGLYWEQRDGGSARPRSGFEEDTIRALEEYLAMSNRDDP